MYKVSPKEAEGVREVSWTEVWVEVACSCLHYEAEPGRKEGFHERTNERNEAIRFEFGANGGATDGLDWMDISPFSISVYCYCYIGDAEIAQFMFV